MKKYSLLAFVFSATVLGLLVLPQAGCQPPVTSEPKQSISQASFDTTINQDKLILVKFGATWCPPCRDIDRELTNLAGQLPADVEVLKIDVEENPELAKRYDISGIPKMLLVRNGEILAEEIGYMSGDKIQSWIDEYRRQ